MQCLRVLVFLCLVFLGGSSLSAEVLQLIIVEREPFATDVSEKVGPYERIRGRVGF